jgi:hypothetical protein
MADKIITYITDAAGKRHPAEVRGAIPQKELVAIYRDFETTKLLTETFSWVDGHWVAKNGSTIDYDGAGVVTTPEIAVRISKK